MAHGSPDPNGGFWNRYGVLAEIGAGQEVARWFFRVGGAAGTIAKSVSAYDMTISDTMYGAAERWGPGQRPHAVKRGVISALPEALLVEKCLTSC